MEVQIVHMFIFKIKIFTHLVEMLISRGARVHSTNMGDDTPLHLAAAHGNRDIVLMVSI